MGASDLMAVLRQNQLNRSAKGIGFRACLGHGVQGLGLRV